MIFVKSLEGEAMFLMLSEPDIELMRQGNTKFVDERSTGGETFKKVILSLHKTDEEAVAILRQAGHTVPARSDMKGPAPKRGESHCKGCNCLTENIFEGHCITCWATMAKGRAPLQDGQHQHGEQ